MIAEVTVNSSIIELAKLSRLLDEAGWRLKEAERKAVNTEHNYQVARAKALLACQDGTVSEREARALLAVEAERLAARVCEAELRILRSDIRILENRMDVGRSVVGVLRAEAAVR